MASGQCVKNGEKTLYDGVSGIREHELLPEPDVNASLSHNDTTVLLLIQLCWRSKSLEVAHCIIENLSFVPREADFFFITIPC